MSIRSDEEQDGHDLVDDISRLLRRQHKVLEGSIFWLKVLLLFGGALIAALASLFPDVSAPAASAASGSPAAPNTWSSSQTWGVVGAVFVFVGSIFVLRTESKVDSSFNAFDALTELDAMRQQNEEYGILFDQSIEVVSEVRSLYFAFSSAREFLERASIDGIAENGGKSKDEELIAQCLWGMKQDLVIASGFSNRDTWTLCVYKSEFNPDKGYTELRCVATQRSLECLPSEARCWKEGVGVGGMALAKNGEVVAPDILAPEAGSLFALDGDIVRPEDLARYRSLIAVPINVNGDQDPWGVALASSDVADHFGSEEIRPGASREEATRVLAAVSALAVAICRDSDHLG